MIKIDEKEKCAGCTACCSICPKKCIEMKPDEEGFLYPVVDTEKCVDCHLCEKVCPVLHHKIEEKIPGGYVCRSKDLGIVAASTSGGMFTPISRWIIEQGGVIFGVGFGEDWMVKHKMADSLEAAGEFRGSKYVQSYLGDTFENVKKKLEEDRWVCFSGTPCQAAGLKAYLNKEYEKLLIVEVICHGTPSPALWKKYVDYQEKRSRTKLKSVNFRAKTYGYHSGSMELQFQNGKKYKGSARTDYMLKSFFKEISSRPSCYHCAFKTVSRVSDLSLFDAWHVSQLVPGVLDDDKGYTNVLVHTEKGQKLLEELREQLELYPADVDKMVELDGIMVKNSAKPHPKRKEYLKAMNELPIEALVRKFLPISRKDHVIERMKTLIYKCGFIELARAVKKKLKK